MLTVMMVVVVRRDGDGCCCDVESWVEITLSGHVIVGRLLYLTGVVLRLGDKIGRYV